MLGTAHPATMDSNGLTFRVFLTVALVAIFNSQVVQKLFDFLLVLKINQSSHFVIDEGNKKLNVPVWKKIARVYPNYLTLMANAGTLLMDKLVVNDQNHETSVLKK